MENKKHNILLGGREGEGGGGVAFCMFEDYNIYFITLIAEKSIVESAKITGIFVDPRVYHMKPIAIMDD